MANPPRNRKRVHALRRAPDGSAFHRCDECGSSVPVVLMDMHECQGKKGTKMLKSKCDRPVVVKKTCLSDEPRSAFQFFLEDYARTCEGEDLIEVNRKAFDKWKKMSPKEQCSYFQKAEEVDKAYMKVLSEEVKQMSQEGDDEADSTMVQKLPQHYEDYDYEDYDDDSDSSGCNSSWSEEDYEAFREWKKMRLC